MNWIDDIANYLQTNNIGTLGTNIFISGFDKRIPNCITLFNQPGQYDIVTLSNDQVMHRPEFGVRVRNLDDVTAESKAIDIYLLLNLLSNCIIGSTRFKKITAVSPPFFLEKDDNDRYVYSINFSLEIG